jgi:hypothetical protein
VKAIITLVIGILLSSTVHGKEARLVCSGVYTEFGTDFQQELIIIIDLKTKKVSKLTFAKPGRSVPTNRADKISSVSVTEDSINIRANYYDSDKLISISRNSGYLSYSSEILKSNRPGEVGAVSRMNSVCKLNKEKIF